MHSRGIKKQTINHPIFQDNYSLILILKQRRWHCTNPDCRYDQYIAYVDKYFPNAVPVVDSLHVIQWITRLIDNYIRQLLKKYRQRDRELAEQRSIELQKTVLPQFSDEFYLLQKYRWLILSSISNIKYHADPRMDSHFRCLMNTYDYEDALFRIDPRLKDFRNLKELYIQFNNRNGGHPIEALKKLDKLISIYQTSEYEIFREFASLLEKYRDPIINSFIIVEKHEKSMTATYPMAPWNPSSER